MAIFNSSLDYDLRVSCFETPIIPTKRHSLSASQLYISSKVEISLQPSSAKRKFIFSSSNFPTKISILVSDHAFRFPCNSLNSNHGLQTLTSMISDMKIPFPLQKNILWRRGFKSDKPWTLLADPNDLLTHIHDLIASCTFDDKIEKPNKEFKMNIHIEKRMYLPNSEYEALVQEIQEKERFMKRKKMRLLLPPSLDDMRVTEAMIEETDCKCGICQKQVELASYVVRAPCSHFFHRECIRKWLLKSHNCPFCQFNLD